MSKRSPEPVTPTHSLHSPLPLLLMLLLQPLERGKRKRGRESDGVRDAGGCRLPSSSASLSPSLLRPPLPSREQGAREREQLMGRREKGRRRRRGQRDRRRRRRGHNNLDDGDKKERVKRTRAEEREARNKESSSSSSGKGCQEKKGKESVTLSRESASKHRLFFSRSTAREQARDASTPSLCSSSAVVVVARMRADTEDRILSVDGQMDG